MLYIFDKDDILLEIIEDFEDDEMNRELNSDWTYNFKIDINTSKNIKKPNKVGFFDDDEFYLFLIDEVNDTIFSEDIKSVYCINDMYSINGHIIEDKRCVDYSIDKALEKALEGTGYVVGEVDTFDINTVSFYYISSLAALNKIVEAYNAEYMPRVEYNKDTNKIEKYIDVKVKIGKDTGLRFTYDTNIEEIKRNEASDNHYTVLYGRGASLQMTDEEGQETGGYTRLIDFSDIEWSKENGDPCDKPLGQKYVEDVEAIEKYGRIEGIYENKDIESTSELLQATYEALQETKEINVSYEVSVQDLSNIEGFEHYKYILGDRIIILDDDYDINLESRIIKETLSKKKKTKVVTLGYIFPSMSSNNASNIVDGNNDEKEKTEDKFSDEDFPNTLPDPPILSIDREGFASISLSWTFENKPYYVYELYASQLENFNPTENHLVWRGHGSAFLHEVNFNETWYYRARVINSHGQYTDFSNQVSATTYKIDDATEIFENAAIKEALIESLNADKINSGKVKGTYIDARNLSVTDGNGDITFYINDIGELIGRFKKLSIEGNSIDEIVSEQIKTTVKSVNIYYYLSTSLTELVGGTWQNKAPTWEKGKYMWQKTITTYNNDTTVESTPVCIAGAKGEDGTSVNIKGSFTSTDELTSVTNPQSGDGYLIDGDLWVYDGSSFNNVGQIKGDKGDKGDTGVSVTSISERYGISDSKDTEPTTWYSSFPEWSEGKYIWTKTRIVYSDGTVEYTTPYVDTSWEQVMNDVNNKVDNSQEAIFNTLTNGGETQGIYLLNGKIYINLEYMKANSLSASKITFDDLTGKTIKGARFFTAPNTDATDGYLFRIYSDGRVYSSNLVQVYGETDDGVYSQMKPGIVSATEYMRSPGIKTSNSAFYIAIKDAAIPGDGDSTYRLKFVRDGDYSYFVPDYPGGESAGVRLGSQGKPWNICYAKKGVSTSSDRTLKENIKYLSNDNNPNVELSTITEDDLYNFVKDDLGIAEYNFIGEDEKFIGFIAQDLLYNSDGSDNIIGQLIVNKSDERQDPLTYSEKNYTGVLAGALRKAIHKIEALESKLGGE